MYRRGGSRNRGSNTGNRGGRNGRQSKPRGLFANGIWHCNCDPRLPAEHFKVKKEGPNTGRWFYTCQKVQDKRCDFFLWDEDAKPREEAAVLNNSRTEPGQAMTSGQDGWDAGRSRTTEDQPQRGKGLFARDQQQRHSDDDASTQSPTPSPSGNAIPASKSGKRDADEAMFDADDFFDSSDDGLNEPANMGDGDKLVTPRKALKTGIYATPATTGKRKLPWLEQPSTPGTTSKKAQNVEDYFSTPSKKQGEVAVPLHTDMPETPPVAPTSTTAGRTPSPPARYKDALAHPADSTSSLTYEVMTCLNSAKTSLPSETLTNVRSILSKHDLKAQGITRGRDISRLAIRAKDAKIAELQARIASLEAEREVEKGVKRLRRWERETSRQG